MIFNIYLTNLLRALSLALELSDGDLSRHHWRTAMIADRIAMHIGLPHSERQTLLYAALLHDIGAAARWEERRNLYTHQPLPDLKHHAEAGYLLLKDSRHFGAMALPIRHHHDYWDGSAPSGLAGRDIPLLSRILCLADTVEVLLRDDVYILEQRDGVMARVAGERGTKFDPELVRALEELAQQECFWLDLSNPHYYSTFFQNTYSFGQVYLNIDDVLDVADIFATIIDRTSRYTARHSRSVTEVAAFLAEVKGYSESEVKMMRIAGLLHDLGKLTVPNAILEKPGRLTEQEFSIVKQHAYYSYRILNEIDGFNIIAEWAAFHHERLDGTGYPFRIGKSSLRLGSRIVAVADVFAALAEDRPYRAALGLAEIEGIMSRMVAEEKLDEDLVHDLFIHGELAVSLARGEKASKG